MMITKLNRTEAVAKSSYRAEFYAQSCIGCGICEKRCPMGAFHMHDEVVDYNVAKCIGCGLCTSKCPTDAITLVKRNDYIRPPDSMGDLMKKIVENKRK
jgi:ferredoxin